jgi:hypothetical protein
MTQAPLQAPEIPLQFAHTVRTFSLLPPKTNPRSVIAEHRERGPRRYHYTAALVAELAGAPLSAVRRAAAKVPGREPYLDLRSLRSVIAWVSRQRACRGLGAL